MDLIQDLATFHRTTLLLGLTDGDPVIRWAEETIDSDPLAPGAVFDVVLTSPADLTAMRLALQPLTHPVEPPAVIRAVFDRLWRDLESGRRSLRDTVTVLSQIRRTVAISSALHAKLDGFEDDFMLAAAGVVGAVPPIEAEIRDWLAGFAGAEEVLRVGIEYRVLRYDRTAEAAAFVAAVSRIVDSPRGDVRLDEDPLEIWVAANEPGAVSVFLTPAALTSAASAFSPLPATTAAGIGEIPPDAVLVVDGAHPRPLGMTEVERLLAVPSGPRATSAP